LLALLALGTYGYYNKQHNNRGELFERYIQIRVIKSFLGITTALQQDFHVARQWTISKINNAYNSLPSPVGIFKSAIDYSRNFVYNFGSFIGDVISSIGSFIFNFWAGILNRISWAWQSMRRWFSNIPNPLNYLPNFSKIIGNVTESIKSIFNFFIDIFVTLARSIYSGFQNITNRVSSAFSTTYSYIPSSSNVVGKVSKGSKSIFSTASTFASNVFSSITGFFGKIFEGLKTLAYNILSLVFHLFSSISQFVVKIFERIKALAYNTLNFISDTFLSIAKFADKGLEGLKELVYNIFTFLYDAFWYIIKSVQNAVSAIVQHVYHFFRVLYQWITNKFTELYGYLPDFSNISNVISEKTHNVLSYVSNSYNNFYTSVTKWGKSFCDMSLDQSVPVRDI
jgi:phage-related protein